MNGMPVDAIRIAVGSKDGRKSSTWRIWGNKKGDIYAAARILGGIFKISLHKDGNCQAGFTKEYLDKMPALFKDRSRHLDRWKYDLETPHLQVQIFFPENELRVFKSKEEGDVDWVPVPKGQMFVISIYNIPKSISDVQLENQKTVPIASFEGVSRNALIVGHYQDVDPEIIGMIEKQKQGVIAAMNIAKAEGCRIIAGTGELDGRRCFFDIAWQDLDS